MRFQAISALALVGLAGCGTLSNDDLAFIEAVPPRSSLHVDVPRSGAQALSTLGPATVYTDAVRIAGSVNAGLDGVLAFLDVIRGVTPSTRSPFTRTWGPFPDREHPGVRYRAVMTRQLNSGGAGFEYDYAIDAGRPPAADLRILEGTFFGAQARHGAGKLVIHFENSQALGIAKPNDPQQAMLIQYDFTSDPNTLQLDLGLNAAGGFGLPAFDYGYARYADGHGRFDYGGPDGKGNIVVAQTRFTRTASGRALIDVTRPPFFEDKITECWDETASLTFIADPAGIVSQCNQVAPCVLGDPGACPAVP